jgi:3'-5' exoribonuclease
MKQIYVSELRPGQPVSDRFILAEKHMARKKDGGAYMTVSFADKTGSVRGVIWDNIEKFRTEPTAGDFVHVAGEVTEFRGVPQIVVKNLAPIAAGELRPEDFLPATRRDPDAMLAKIIKLSESVSNDFLKTLLEAFWDDADFVRRFRKAPAAKHMHHAYLGGLLEHTLSLALLADRIADHYGGIDRDLLLTGAILHDIGKIKEFVYERRIDYSDEGRLVSHIVTGVEMVQEKIAGIADFPPSLALQVKHLLVSHHGSREFGSPEPPKTLEAVLLNYLDEIDSKISGIREFMEKQETEGDWTAYHKPLERFFYKGAADFGKNSRDAEC